MSKKILKICSTKYFADTVLTSEINYILDSGYTLELACPFDEQKENSNLKCKSIDVYISRKLQFFSNIRSLIKLLILIRQENYDIVHTHNHLSGILGRIAAKISGVKLIIHTAHGFYFHERMNKSNYLFYYLAEKFVGLFTNKILIESKEDVDTVIRTKMLNRNQIHYVGGGIDLQKFTNNYSLENKNELKEILCINKESTVLGITARITVEKGYNELISAFIKLIKKYPNLHLIIIGANLPSERDPYYDELLKIISEYKLNNKITITFKSSEIPKLLSIMDIFLLPSHREGLPRSIMEAMAMKLPIIATDIRGCREEVVHQETGLLIEPKSSHSLYKAIKQLIINKESRISMGLKGNLRALKLYDEKVLFKKVLTAYEVQ